MTPMIDVIFLLLIFFVCTASFQPPEEVLPTNMSLPGSTSETVADRSARRGPRRDRRQGPVATGRASVGGQPARVPATRQVGGVLRQSAGFQDDLPVILDVEGVVPMENVIDVYDLCRQIGLQRIQFAAAAGS